MRSILFATEASIARRLPVLFLLVSIVLTGGWVNAQTLPDAVAPANLTSPGHAPGRDLPGTIFRVERLQMPVGAELITVFAKQRPGNAEVYGPVADLPLISVLRDNLGDHIVENDRLRYIWALSYTKPTFAQRAASFVPFLYTRTSNGKVGSGPPPHLMDLQSDRVVWNKVLWFLFKKLVIGEFSPGGRASALQYRQNSVDHRRAAIADALAVLALFQEIEGEKVLTDVELSDIQAKLALDDRTFGWAMQSENFSRVYETERRRERDHRSRNWELLRQYSESQGLLFEPIEMEDGYARHAVVWTTEADIQANQGKDFKSRFLNIKNPWKDRRLARWQGYKRVRWFDEDSRQVDPRTPGATAKTMIPLALYGLDHPKIPVLLIDFRNTSNPKRRELSRRILADVTNNVLAGSRFNGFPYVFGRFIYEFVTGRRGMDINQTSRFRAYSQLKLLISLDESLDPELRDEVAQHVEAAGTNPMDNGVTSRARIAAKQYENLLAYANRPDGLPKQIIDDRREEMVRVAHSRTTRALLSAASVFSLGLYRHREKESPELYAKLDHRRQMDFHERFIREVAYRSSGPEIDSDMIQLKRSLDYLAKYGTDAEEKTARALSRIFSISNTEATRLLCLAGLYRINNSTAKKELLAIYKASRSTERWHQISAEYLRLALDEGQKISSRDVSSISAIHEAAAH